VKALLEDGDTSALKEVSAEEVYAAHREIMFAQETYMRSLLASPNLYHLNLHDTDGMSRLVHQLVRLDRLPSMNPPEGLSLLRDAWRDYDVAMHLAWRYKLVCKVLFVLQLFLSWLVVLGPTLTVRFAESGVTHVVFGISVTVSFLASLDGILAPKSRWRQLRSGAGSLQSTIWLYRARVGPFELDERRRDSTRPEEVLCTRLNEWRDSLVASASLQNSNLKREYAPQVYRHFQDRGEPADGGDDFQSPTQPARYIALRIHPTLALYQKRIPAYTRRGLALRVTVILLGIAASVLARYEYLGWVAIAAAAATAVTSWTEFSDVQRKVERYTNAVTELSKLLSWWSALGEVQKASKDSISKLVCRSEMIIAEELISWNSTAAAQHGTNVDNGIDETNAGGANQAQGAGDGARGGGQEARRARIAPAD